MELPWSYESTSSFGFTPPSEARKTRVLCLIETKISSVDFEKLKWKINFDCAL